METVDYTELPRIRFAHVFQAEQYEFLMGEAPDRAEITYIADGEITVRREGESYVLHKGDVLCNLRTAPLEIRAPTFHCHHTVQFRAAREVLDAPGALRLPLITRAQDGTSRICELIDECIYRPTGQKGGAARDAAYVLGILCEIDRVCRSARHLSQNAGTLLTERAIRYIHRHIHDPIRLSEIAAHLGVSEGYLCSTFSANAGVSVIRYVNSMKLQGIRELIESENVRLYEAAAQYGYSDPNYVSTLYKRTFGHTVTAKPNRPLSSGEEKREKKKETT